MVAQISTSIQTSIIHSYIDFDGTVVDIVEMVYPDGFTETRQCWEEETLDVPNYCLKTQNGTIVKTTQRNSRNKKWLNSYRQLKEQAQRELNKLQNLIERDSKEQEEIELDRYQQAKADLGFSW